jgi:hypothetical protein
MRSIVLLTLCGLFLNTGSASAFTYWNDFRASALLPGDQVTLRVENPQGPGETNTVLYDLGGIQEVPLTAVDDGPATLEALVPGPVAASRSYGFRYMQTDKMDLMAVRLPDGATPIPADLTLLTTDPVGDEAFGLPNLDLTEVRISTDGTRLFASLTNAGGGFPVNSGLTFYSYFLGISNPAATDPDTVFAMIHTVTAAGIIEPGLYRVFGTGTSDLAKIGEITATEFPAENRLLISCLLSDLEADPDFASWYDPAEPILDVAGFTQRITLLGGVGEADRTAGGDWHLRGVSLAPGTNQLPQLADLMVPAPPGSDPVLVTYQDADGNCPVTAEIVFDGGATYPLYPQSLDYSGPVVYTSDPGLPPLTSGGWSQLAVRFSDNAVDVVELTEDNVSPVFGGPGLSVRAFPNPFSGQTKVSFELPRGQKVSLEVYDLRGRCLTTLVDADLGTGFHARSWNGKDDAGRPQPAGVYFYRLLGKDVDVVERVTLVR